MPTYDPLNSLELTPWASAGNIEAPSGTKIDTGWEGEEKPPHEFFNWWMNNKDRFILWLLQSGVPKFIPTFAYEEFSVVKGSSGSLFSAKQDSTGQDPELDLGSTYWRKIIDVSGAVAVDDISPYMYTLLAATDADTAQTLLGGTTVGKALFNAASEAAARTAIGGNFFLDRGNHTGTQPISSVALLQTTLDAKEVTVNKSTTLAGANDTTYPTTKAVADAISIAASGESYRGEWDASTNTPTLVSGVGTNGYYYRVSVAGTTTLDGINSWTLGDEVYFNGTVWVKRPNYFPSLTTDDVAEGTKQYFTAARVRAVLLDGLSLLSTAAVTATDNLVVAVGKLQAQLNLLTGRVNPSGGTTDQVLTKNSGTDYDYSWKTPSSSQLVVPVFNFGNRAVSGSEAISFDMTTNNDWNVSLNTSNVTGALTINLTNLPNTTNGKYVAYFRIVRGGIKTVTINAPAGKTWNPIQGSLNFTNVAGEYDVVMFYNQYDEAKIHAMIVDTGVL